jgi:hypothetical protein
LLLRRRLAAFGPVARLDFALDIAMRQTAEFVIKRRQIYEFSWDQRLTKVRKWSNQETLCNVKSGTDVNFSQSEIFLQ